MNRSSDLLSLMTNFRRPIRIMSLLTVLMLLLAACGGGTTTPTEATTQAAATSVSQATAAPEADPTEADEPTAEPTVAEEPTEAPTEEPTVEEEPTEEPTATEEIVATEEPTEEPVATEEATAAPPAEPVKAIVRNTTVNIREGPSARKDANGQDIYRIITTRNQGDELEVLGRGFLDFPWVQVRIEGEQTGWVSADPAFAEVAVPLESLPLVSWYPPDSILQRTIELDGPHSMEVENLGERDAVLVLAQELNPVLAVYVRAGQTYTVDGIPNGTFDVFDSRGGNWNGREFMSDASRSKWTEPLPFANNENGNPIIWTLTLDSGESDDGEAQDSDPVDQSDFPGITTQE